MQRDMRDNAESWKIISTGETVPINEIANFMELSRATWQKRLDDINNFQTNEPIEFPKVVAMYEKLGGTTQDFNDTKSPLQTVVTQMQSAPKTTYAELITICDQIMATVDKPLTVWDE